MWVQRAAPARRQSAPVGKRSRESISQTERDSGILADIGWSDQGPALCDMERSSADLHISLRAVRDELRRNAVDGRARGRQAPLSEVRRREGCERDFHLLRQDLEEELIARPSATSVE